MLCNFLERMLKCFKKNLKNFFCPQKVEKTTPKSCILMEVGIFFSLQPRLPKTAFPFYKFFYPTISGRISGGVFLFSYSGLQYWWAVLHTWKGEPPILKFHFDRNKS